MTDDQPPRRAQLRRLTPMPRGASPMRRSTRLTRVAMGRRRTPREPGEVSTRRIVQERSGGVCERCGLEPALNSHHRKNRSQGGRWDPANILDLCGSGTTGCHGFITNHPTIAVDNGWSVRSGAEPSAEPVLLAFHGWCLLAPGGDIEHVDPPTLKGSPR